MLSIVATTNLIDLKSLHKEDHKAAKKGGRDNEREEGEQSSSLWRPKVCSEVAKVASTLERPDVTMALSKCFCKSTMSITHYHL